MNRNFARISGLALASMLLLPSGALAQDEPDAGKPAKQSVELAAETQEFSKGYGSLRSVRLEYRVDFADTTVTFTPMVGERRSNAGTSSAIGGGATIYHDWSDTLSTRTRAFVSENAPVFADVDLSQDVSLRVADKTVLTVGGRWARYFGKQDVYFVSGGLRQYFKGGSIAYRLTWVKPEGRDAFLSQLASVTINDARGGGKTQLWLNYGGASFDRALDSTFSGDDYGGLVQRIQPLDKSLSLSLSAGLQSYARPVGRIEGTKLGLGLQYSLK